MKFSNLATLLVAPAALVTASGLHHRAIVHPGLLHTDADFERIRSKVDSGAEPWTTGLAKLVARTDASYEPDPQELVCRGTNAGCDENYGILYRDIHAAYANAVYWKISDNTTFADAAVRTVDAWSSTMKELNGSSDQFLASGIYGYQFANVAELLRTYDNWDGLDAAIKLLRDVFYASSHRFLTTQNGADPTHYWANWDLANLCNVHAVGVLSDNQTMVDEALTYFNEGIGNGALEHAIWKLYEEEDTGKALGQNQEAGRDQGHATLDFAHLGAFAQQSYNQGKDLFALLDNRILAGSEYMAKYNTGNDVPFTEYSNVDVTQTVISNASRGTVRPIGELLYAHYNGVKGLDASWTKAYRDFVVEEGGGAEGGGGDYGTTSGGYDQFGFGTLLFRLDE